MRFISFILFFLLMTFAVPAQDVTGLLKEAYNLEMIPNEKGALAKYKEVLKLQPLNIFSLCRSSELCSRIGKREKDEKLRDDYFSAAKTYATIALKIDPNHGEANAVMAIALGRSSMSKSGKDKITNAKDVKAYLDKALLNDPQNYKAWHVMGRWQYEISNLNMLERAAVNLLYGGMPQASLRESIAAFEKARVLAPWFILNYFEMARAYHDHNEYGKAIEYIKLLLTLPNVTEDDPAIKEKAKWLLSIWM